MRRLEKHLGGRIYGTRRLIESKRQKREMFKRTLRSQFWNFDEAKPLAYFFPLPNRQSQIVWYNWRQPFLVSGICLQEAFHSFGRIINSRFIPVLTQIYLEKKWVPFWVFCTNSLKLTVTYETVDPAHSVQVWDHSHPSSRWDNQIVVLALGLLGKEEVVRRVGIIEHLKTSSKWRNQPNWKPRSWFVNTAMHPSVGLHGEDFFFNGHSLEVKESSGQRMHSSMLVNILVTNDTLKCGASVQCAHPRTRNSLYLSNFLYNLDCSFFFKKKHFYSAKKNLGQTQILDKSFILK